MKNNVILDMSEFKEEIIKLENIFYEIEGRKQILELMILEGCYNENQEFKNFYDEYLQYLKLYEILKNNFYYNHLSEYKQGIWSLDFNTRTVVITIEDEE